MATPSLKCSRYSVASQQAAKELMQEEERLKLHMRLGLAIISHVLETDPENELFFIGITQSKFVASTLSLSKFLLPS